MKRLVLLIILFALVLSFSADQYAKEIPGKKKKNIVRTLINGITSDNQGLRISSALQVYELVQHNSLTAEDFSPAVMPLMDLARKGSSEMEKIAAALSLHIIDEAAGKFSLGEIINNGSKRYLIPGKIQMHDRVSEGY